MMCKKMVFPIAFALLLSISGNVAADLVGHWRFDGNLDDSIGGAHGTFNGGSPTYVKGSIGQGIEFDGMSHFVHLPSVNPSAYTITLWVRPARTDAASVIVRTSGSGQTTHWSHQLRINPQGVFHHYLWVGSERNLAGTTPVEVDEWYHVAIAAANDGPMYLYVNAEEDAASIDVAGTLWGEGDRYYVGSNSGHSMGWFQGIVDDVQIDDSILTAEEIGRIAASSGGFPLAFGPTPKDGALHPDTWVTLSWRPGDFAVSHDVYLGDNYDDVDNGTGDTFRGNQTGTFLVAGFPGYPYPDGLVPGTTYYWRVDEVNDADPNSPWKGDVWSFSVPPKTAYDPSPADGAESVGPDDVTLTWTVGFGAKLHTVYFGESFDEVNDAIGGAPGGIAMYNPGPLETEKVYYWRVDEFDAVATYKGDVWSFSTPGAVGSPQPAYKATDIAMNVKLNWTDADSAFTNHLYFGTDKEAVRNADTSAPEYKGSIFRPDEIYDYDPGLLEADTAYYWHVDAVDAQDNVSKGPLWVFTTGAFLLVDDFEIYTDDDAANRAIWQTWIDGFGVPDNGAQVGYLMPPYAEQTTVHGGLQSMPLLYINETGVTNSEATTTLTVPRDWTQAGVAQLSLWFRGASGNAAEPLYVSIANSAGAPAVVANDDSSAATVRAWTQWMIPLQAFADQGINLSNVDQIAVGLGSTGGAAAGGSGTMYIDDIRLYRSGEAATP